MNKTQQELLDAIVYVDPATCPHPIEERYMSRCLLCADPISQVARDKEKNFYKQGKKKADKKKEE